MTKVVADITMSLDGFVTGPDPGPEQGLGRGGEPLHAWVESERDVRISPTATHLTYALHI